MNSSKTTKEQSDQQLQDLQPSLLSSSTRQPRWGPKAYMIQNQVDPILWWCSPWLGTMVPTSIANCWLTRQRSWPVAPRRSSTSAAIFGCSHLEFSDTIDWEKLRIRYGGRLKYMAPPLPWSHAAERHYPVREQGILECGNGRGIITV